MFKALSVLLDQNDRKAIEMAAQMYAYTSKSSTPSVVTNIQNNFGSGPRGGQQGQQDSQMAYFESIVRRLDTEEEKKSNPPSAIIDAEEVS